LGLLFSDLLYLNVLSMMPDIGKTDHPVIPENSPNLGSVESVLKLNNFLDRFFEIRMKENQVRTFPAELDIHVGETYDFLWTPEESGSYTLSILTTFDRGAPAFPRDAPEPHRVEIEVKVNEP